MLYAGGNDVVARFLKCGGHAIDRPVVGLGATAGEHNLSGSAVEDGRNPVSRFVQRVSGLLAHGVEAGRISVRSTEIGQHSFQDLGVHGSCAGMV